MITVKFKLWGTNERKNGEEIMWRLWRWGRERDVEGGGGDSGEV